MNTMNKKIAALLMVTTLSYSVHAQRRENVSFVKSKIKKQIEVLIGGKNFTTFNYPDSIEKPFLYPIITAKGIVVTRGFPLDPKPGDPTDHPHHIGLWFNYENVNGLDFWNNS